MRRRLVHFGNAGALAAPLEERALAAAGGNPRLMQRLDRIWADPEVDKESIIAALEAKNNMGPDGRLHQSAAEPAGKASAPLLALLSLYRLPVNRQAVAAVAGEDVLDDDLKPAVALGLIEAMGDAATGERRYRVSSDVSPSRHPRSCGISSRCRPFFA